MSTKTNPRLVAVHDLDVSKLSIGQIEDKKFEKGTETGTYKSIPIFYQNDDGRNVKLEMEYPVMWVNGLVLDKFGKDGIMPKFDLEDPDSKKMAVALREIHHRIADMIYPSKGKAGLPSLTKGDLPLDITVPSMYENTGFKGMIKFQVDKDTGEIISGQNPAQYLQIQPWTKFIDVNKNEIPYKRLDKFSFRAVLHVVISHVYSGSNKMSIQCKLQNVLVLDAKPRDTAVKMNDTIEKYKKDPNVNSNISSILGDIPDEDPLETTGSTSSIGKMEPLDPSTISAQAFLS